MPRAGVQAARAAYGNEPVAVLRGLGLEGLAVQGQAQKPIRLVVDAWHAPFAAGSPIDETDPGTFTNPDPAFADRVPQLALDPGGTPGTYTLVGTFGGEERSTTIATTPGATSKALVPFDTLTAITGPDPGAALVVRAGDSYATPPSRALWVGTTGAIACACDMDPAVQVCPGVPGGADWRRRIRRVAPDGTTASGLWFVW